MVDNIQLNLLGIEWKTKCESTPAKDLMKDAFPKLERLYEKHEEGTIADFH
jgi:hypothetical protein